MNFTAPRSNRRPGSNIFAALMGLFLLGFAALTFLLERNPLEEIPYHYIVAATSLLFGAILLIWVKSDWTHWIGNETVNMVVGVVAALIAIIAFAQDIEKKPSSEAKTSSASQE
ncbi:MAG TPA: hypothetical protein VHL31_26430 [Geminicoccus sp.]|jgi:peptidoglycan/LPS O-acetylase OafA/YrhL|uniref:hypothetical protein n=1 Tax=Geminicoccus sp. TaxID=2024832 RepID=UPI002E34FC30|nr:hypothetical protein [Geminicoccus sp.]HEX2529815.1 hypothetical protein [Geminicoccus sp.]